MTFPTTDDDIRFLKVIILRELGASPNVRLALPEVAHRHKLTVDDVKSLVAEHGWPNPDSMLRAAASLSGEPLPPVPVQQRPRVPDAAIEQLLARAAKSPRARTRGIADRIRNQLRELKQLVTDEDEAQRATAAEVARKAALRAEVDRLERELAEKRAALRGTPARKGPVRAKRGGRNPEPARIRAWAADNGVECGPHGRVPEAVAAQYRAATKQAGAA